VLVVVATAIAVACWYQGARALYADFVRDKQTIQSEFSKQDSLLREPFHANSAINEQQQNQNVQQQERVFALWRQLYDRQRAEVLKWPSNLSEEFHRYIEKKSFSDTIRRDLRDHYNQYIGDHFPELPKIVGALDMTSATSSALGGDRGGRSFRSMRGGRGMEMEGGRVGPDGELTAAEEQDFIVEWLDQQRIRDELFAPTTPSSKQIWVTQEDLWVYEALLQIIARTNEAKGADRFSNAAVRTILSLEVGRLAAQASRGRGRIELLAAPGGAGDPMMGGMGGGMRGMEGGGMEGGGMGYGRGGPMGEMGMGGEIGMGMGGEVNADSSLFVSRYLGPDGLPMASTGEGGPQEFGVEFKRLPIRMMLEMDERWLPQLIAECANAPLQVEVTEVRIDPPGGMDSAGGGSIGRGGSMSSFNRQSGEAMVPEREPHIKPISILGTIFIYNPPTEDTAAQQLADVQ
jgi:hypothetical protein